MLNDFYTIANSAGEDGLKDIKLTYTFAEVYELIKEVERVTQAEERERILKFVDMKLKIEEGNAFYSQTDLLSQIKKLINQDNE